MVNELSKMNQIIEQKTSTINLIKKKQYTHNENKTNNNIFK